MVYDEMKIENISDYIKTIIEMNSVNDGLICYRGHANKDWSLIPKIQRDFDVSEEEIFSYERFYTSFFYKRNIADDSENEKLEEFVGCLLDMKQHELPTRLLDWYVSPLTALYCAVSDESEKKKDGCVWILKPEKLNVFESLCEDYFIFDLSDETILTMLYTAFEKWEFAGCENRITISGGQSVNHKLEAVKGKIAACYNDANGRRYNQHMVCTVHNTIRRMTDIYDESILTRIIIPSNKKTTLLQQLSVCGITDSSIF